MHPSSELRLVFPIKPIINFLINNAGDDSGPKLIENQEQAQPGRIQHHVQNGHHGRQRQVDWFCNELNWDQQSQRVAKTGEKGIYVKTVDELEIFKWLNFDLRNKSIK